MADKDAPKDPHDAYIARWEAERANRLEGRNARQLRNREFLRWWVAAMGFTFALFLYSFLALRFGLPGLFPSVSYADNGSMGDAVGPFATIFSTLTLLMALHGMTLQREELALQREESEDNRAEQEGQRLAMEDQVRALAASAETQRLSARVELLKLGSGAIADLERYTREAWAMYDQLQWIIEGLSAHPHTTIERVGAVQTPAPPNTSSDEIALLAVDIETDLKAFRDAVRTFIVSGVVYKSRALEQGAKSLDRLRALQSRVREERARIEQKLQALHDALLAVELDTV